MDMITDKIASAHLGKKSAGSETYDKTLLVAVPRFENRVRYGINNDELPFAGFDVWHAYEFSAMNENGLPVTRVLKLRYSAESAYIIESKSLKLYLNSFNMTRLGSTSAECLDLCRTVIEKDLSEKLETKVEAVFFDNDVSRVDILTEYKDLMDCVDESAVKITEFKESPELLKVKEGAEVVEHKLRFESLRSNCRVTHQPDFGDVFIYYKSSKIIDCVSLVKYLVSFRSEYHFHEECCEMIYKRLYDLLDIEDELFVCALYTRRGGIDISPVRWKKGVNMNDVAPLFDLRKFARYGIKQ
ncbi:MAG: NADPH-dependent 7-cyano-7-deazaguanine reductase QueF [Muribaculaceae bacterium]|nr:NADPH-dependent 7-cyano-7-deazaguanine reductase QueF [Muribaculaceae bacterium]